MKSNLKQSCSKLYLDKRLKHNFGIEFNFNVFKTGKKSNVYRKVN